MSTCRALGFDFASTTRLIQDLPPGQWGIGGPTRVVDNITCNSGCTYSECMKCSDATGNGTISGQIFDAVYSFAPVPGARVTLYSRGIRVKDAIADKDGKYKFEGIVTNAACSNYKIVVDLLPR
jgi:hypothetical protein